MMLGALFDTDISITDNKIVGGKNLNLSLIFNLLHHIGQIICHEDLHFEIDEDNANEQFVKLYKNTAKKAISENHLSVIIYLKMQMMTPTH